MENENWFDEITKEYSSLEKYIEYMVDNGADPLIIGYKPFRYLLEKGLLKENDIIRTNLEGGVIDGHYRITSEGKLEGIKAAGGIYSGDSGIHNPKKILSLNKADNGWTLGYLIKIRISRLIENTY